MPMIKFRPQFGTRNMAVRDHSVAGIQTLYKFIHQ